MFIFSFFLKLKMLTIVVVLFLDIAKGGHEMKKNNQDIREKILKSHLKYWQIAEQLNINDGNFSRMLRKELPKEAKEKINNIIETIRRKEKNVI